MTVKEKEFNKKEIGLIVEVLKNYKLESKNVTDSYLKEFALKLGSFFSKKDAEKRFNPDNNKYDIGFLAFAPNDVSGYYNTCKNGATKYCQEYCVGENGSNSKIQMSAQLKRTILFTNYTNYFIEKLCLEIAKKIKNSINKGRSPVFRLNGYSDITWETFEFSLSIELFDKITNILEPTKRVSYDNNSFKDISLTENIYSKKKGRLTIFELFSGILFYDYTKHTPEYRLSNINSRSIKNYHLTYSYNIKIKNEILEVLRNMNNVTFICLENVKKEIMEKELIIKKEFNKRLLTFIDGDKCDFRFLDDINISEYGKVILLSAQKVTKSELLDKSETSCEEIENNLEINEVVLDKRFFFFKDL